MNRILFLMIVLMLAFNAEASLWGVIRDAITGTTMIVNSEGRAEVVQHAHVDSGTLTFHIDALAADASFILIDLSDTTNFPHSNTGYIHIEWISVEIDGTTAPAADYTADIAFLADVTATNGDRYAIEHISGTRATGTSKEEKYWVYPNGWRDGLANHLTSASLISLNDVTYQTDVNLPSTVDPTASDTPPGSGDYILYIDWTAGTLDITVDIAYHSHV